MTLPDLVGAARRLLKTGGRFVTIYAAERITDLLFQMRSALIEPKCLRNIHSSRQSKARLILVEGVKNGGPGVTVSPPLVIYNESGSYSEELQALFSP